MYTDQQEANALKTIENQTFDMERALYGSRDVEVKNCRFDGPADGGERVQRMRQCPCGSLLFQSAVPVLA